MRQLAYGRGEGGEGAKSYGGEKAWSSINHLILPDPARWPDERHPYFLCSIGKLNTF